MPYIKKERRDSLWAAHTNAQNPGELNYLFTRLALDYWLNHPNYQGINDIIGALEGAKLEFYRRYVAHYEDKKMAENGDVP